MESIGFKGEKVTEKLRIFNNEDRHNWFPKKNNLTAKACSTHEDDEKFWSELEEKHHLGHLGVHWKIILRWPMKLTVFTAI